MRKLQIVLLALALIWSVSAFAQQPTPNAAPARTSCSHYFQGCQQACNGRGQKCYGNCDTRLMFCKQNGVFHTGDGRDLPVASRD